MYIVPSVIHSSQFLFFFGQQNYHNLEMNCIVIYSNPVTTTPVYAKRRLKRWKLFGTK